MAVSPKGVLVVATRAEVVALPDANHDGVAEPTVLSSGMTYAHSVAFNGGYLYVGTTPAVVRVKWANGAVAGPVETYVELPSSAPAMHTSRSIAFGPDGRLYVGIGSSCNVCIESDPRRTTIQVFDGPGSKGRAYASGLHNPVGFDWDPVTRRMWAADTGQEQLGDDYPAATSRGPSCQRDHGRTGYDVGSALAPNRLGPVLQPQVGHALELRGVVRDQRQPTDTGVGRDEQIVGPDHGSSPLQVGADLSVVKRRVLIERNGLHVR